MAWISTAQGDRRQSPPGSARSGWAPPARRTSLAWLAAFLVLAWSPVAVARANLRSTQAIAWLNAQRTTNGIPAVVDNPGWDAGCAAHERWMHQNRTFSHEETMGSIGYTPAGAFAGANSLLAEGLGWAPSADFPWGAWNPWESQPIHLMQLLSPDLASTGFANHFGYLCMVTRAGYRRPATSKPALLTYPGDRTSFISPSEQAVEQPFTPGEFFGLPQGAITGPYLYVFGSGTGRGAITAATLDGPSGPVAIRTVDDTTKGKLGNLGSLLPPGGVIIPREPLAPLSSYTARVVFSPRAVDRADPAAKPRATSLSRTWTFATGPLSNRLVLQTSFAFSPVWFSFFSDAPNPALVLYGPGRQTITPTLASANAPGFPGGWDLEVQLAPGVWHACVSSGGSGTSYQFERRCITLTVHPPPRPRLPAPSSRLDLDNLTMLLTIDPACNGTRPTAFGSTRVRCRTIVPSSVRRDVSSTRLRYRSRCHPK